VFDGINGIKIESFNRLGNLFDMSDRIDRHGGIDNRFECDHFDAARLRPA